MSFVNRVKAASLSSEYAQALALHKQAMEAQLELAPIYRFNRFSAERRWRSLCQAPLARGQGLRDFFGAMAYMGSIYDAN